MVKMYMILKWAIRIQAPKVDSDKTTEKVQRLDGSGSEKSSQLL